MKISFKQFLHEALGSPIATYKSLLKDRINRHRTKSKKINSKTKVQNSNFNPNSQREDDNEIQNIPDA